MKYDRVRRRMFLQGMGGATLAIPMLSSLFRRNAHAGGDAQPPVRFIGIKSNSGQTIVDWYPTFEGNGYALREAKADGTTGLTQDIPGTPYTQAPMTDFMDPGLSTIIDQAFNPYLHKMMLLRGMDFLPDTNHNHGAFLGNYAGASTVTAGASLALPHVPTVDQVMAYSDRFYSSQPLVRSLQLNNSRGDSCSYTHAGIQGGEVNRMQAHVDPRTAWNELFTGPGVRPPNPAGEPTQEESPNKRLVDRVYEDYGRIQSNPRLSADDRMLLDRHLTFLNELQGRLEGGGVTAECEFPPMPNSYPDGGSLSLSDIEESWALMIDVAVAGIICDHTRVITIDAEKVISDADGAPAGFTHSENASGQTWHALAHEWGSPSGDAHLQRMNQWVAQNVFLRLIERLDVLEGGESTYLDNSLIVWGNELGFNHLNYSVPTITAGSAGGRIDTGRYLDFTEWDTQSYFSQHNGHVIRGIPYNQFFVTMLQAMGLQPEDYETNGDPGYGSTSTVGKAASTHALDYDFGQIGNPLPSVLL